MASTRRTATLRFRGRRVANSRILFLAVPSTFFFHALDDRALILIPNVAPIPDHEDPDLVYRLFDVVRDAHMRRLQFEESMQRIAERVAISFGILR